MITLFDSFATNFISNGLGNLGDAISCIVTEEHNGGFELELTYPITGIHYKDIVLRRIILAKPTPYSTKQAFRIYSISKVINGVVTFNAQHISYDLSGFPVSPFSATSIQEAFINMKTASVVQCPFTFSSDKSTLGDISITKPVSIRSILGGEILDAYEGDYEFDNYYINLYSNRGSQRGVSIRYGKNLIDLKQEENCASVYTGVYPFWYSENTGIIQLSEKILHASGTYNFTRIYPLDLSQTFKDAPTEEQIRTEANAYMTKNNIGIPKVSIDVSFVQLSQFEEYKNFALLEQVMMCDTVNVEFPELGVSATAKCIKTVYNAITNKYESVELGDAVSNLASTINDGIQDVKSDIVETKSFLQLAIDHATSEINSALGGFVVKRNGELLIMDTEDITTATKVWRWNQNGLGYSATGYNGPFRTAITADGHIVADFMDTGRLTANIIKTGLLRSLNDKVTFNLDNNTFNLGEKLVFDGTNLTFGDGVTLSWGSITGDKPTQYTDTMALSKITSTYIDANGVWTPKVYAQNIITTIAKIASAQIEELIVGTNVAMGPGAVITWANLNDEAKTNLKGPTGAVGPQGIQGPQGYPGTNATNPAWVTNTLITANGVSAPWLQGNRIFTSTDQGSWLLLSGATMSFHKLVSGVDVELFRIGSGMDGSSPDGVSQLFLSNGCSMDTKDGSYRIRTSTTNYLRVNPNGGGIDYINGTTTTPLVGGGNSNYVFA